MQCFLSSVAMSDGGHRTITVARLHVGALSARLEPPNANGPKQIKVVLIF